MPISTLPEKMSETTLIFKNIVPELQKKVDLHIIWLVYSPSKISKKQTNEFETILDIHDYQNFVEILEKEKPDVVYAMANYSLIDFAVSSAAKYLGIPVLSKFMNKVAVVSKNLRKSIFTRFFEKTVPTDEDNSQKQFMGRGRFFLYKWLFLVRTLNATKKGKVKSFFIGLRILTYFANIGKHEGLPEFANTMHWIESEKRRNQLLEFGYDPKSLIVTGNPLYDHIFQKLKKLKEIKNEKPVILFVPLAYYEHGVITNSKNKQIFKKIIQTLNSNNKIKLRIKLHPTSQQESYYKKIIERINEQIEVFTEGDILEQLENADIIISYSGFSTTHISALIFNKPLILCNFFEFYKGPLLEKNIAIECDHILKINQLISSTLDKNPISSEKISEYINKYFYKTDGKSAERLANVIINLTSEKQQN